MLLELVVGLNITEAQKNKIVQALSSMQEIAYSQDSQSKLLNFYVADLLCMAEIDKKKFKKHLRSFNVRQAIDQVVEV